MVTALQRTNVEALSSTKCKLQLDMITSCSIFRQFLSSFVGLTDSVYRSKHLHLVQS